MGKVTQLLDTWQFRDGLLVGCIAVALVLLLAAFMGQGGRPAIAGSVTAVGTLAALQGFGPFRGALTLPNPNLVAIALLGAGGLVVQLVSARRAVHPLAQLAALLPGGAAFAYAFRDAHPSWVPIALAIAAPAITVAVIDLDAFHRRRAFGPAMILVTAMGIYVTVPDTEGSRVLVGALLPLIAVVLPRPAATLGATGSALLVGLLLSVTAIEGAPRPGAIVGGLASFGLLVMEPIARRVLPELKGRDGHDPQGYLRNTIVAVGYQFVVVAWASRVAGLSVSAVRASFIAAVGLLAALFLSPKLPRPPLPERRGPRADRR